MRMIRRRPSIRLTGDGKKGVREVILVKKRWRRHHQREGPFQRQKKKKTRREQGEASETSEREGSRKTAEATCAGEVLACRREEKEVGADKKVGGKDERKR